VQVGSSLQLCRQNSTLHATVQQFPCLSTFGFSSQHGDVYSTEKKEKRKKKGNKLFVFITYVLKHTVASLQIINGGGTRGLEDGSPPAGVPSGV